MIWNPFINYERYGDSKDKEKSVNFDRAFAGDFGVPKSFCFAPRVKRVECFSLRPLLFFPFWYPLAALSFGQGRLWRPRTERWMGTSVITFIGCYLCLDCWILRFSAHIGGDQCPFSESRCLSSLPQVFARQLTRLRQSPSTSMRIGQTAFIELQILFGRAADSSIWTKMNALTVPCSSSMLILCSNFKQRPSPWLYVNWRPQSTILPPLNARHSHSTLLSHIIHLIQSRRNAWSRDASFGPWKQTLTWPLQRSFPQCPVLVKLFWLPSWSPWVLSLAKDIHSLNYRTAQLCFAFRRWHDIGE